MLESLPSSTDQSTGQTASSVRDALGKEDRVNAALAERVEQLLARNAEGALSGEEAGLLRDLGAQLKKQQEQTEMREAQIAWLRAESRRARIAELLEAREKLDGMHAGALKAQRMALPMTPIAVSETAGAIAIDWVPPISCPAATYHLQWREHGVTKWISSAASERIKVPCCTKGQLKLGHKYEFRVRAADPDGKWGPWSLPTEPMVPLPAPPSLPSRPKLRALSKSCLQARWQPPADGEASVASYELQWRRCDGKWGEAGASLETAETTATTPPLETGVHYLFRVRAKLQSKVWTAHSPPSVPLQPVAVKSAARTKGAAGGAAKPVVAAADIPIPVRKPTADDGETVIAEQIREVAKLTTNPDVQAAASKSLEQMAQKKEEDATNLKMLEQRHKALVTRGREEQLNELVAIKQKELAQQLSNGGGGHAAGANGSPNAVGSEGKSIQTDTWD